jgi:predicted amidohydrolase YtcJ
MLEVGKSADITVYDRPLQPTSELLSTKIMMTLVAGKVVYDQAASVRGAQGR